MVLFINAFREVFWLEKLHCYKVNIQNILEKVAHIFFKNSFP